MDNKIKAIREAVSFVRDNWIFKGNLFWQGCGNDFITLLGSLGNEGVTLEDLENLLEAKFDGEPIPVDIDGWFNKDESLAQIIIKSRR